jgi:hypothetical protein
MIKRATFWGRPFYFPAQRTKISVKNKAFLALKCSAPITLLRTNTPTGL